MRAFVTTLLCIGFVVPSYAAIKMEQITYGGDSKLQGYVCYDDATQARRPGILVVHEWWGLNDYAKERARSLAHQGYVALALDMYGEGKTTDHPQTAGEWSSAVDDEQRNERFQAALEQLRSHKLVDPQRIAAIGYCFGGGVVLRMAASGADLRGVVSFHGSLPTSSIAPGTVKAKILACHGADDPFVNGEQVQKFQQALTEAGANWELIVFGGAKHSFTVKEADSRGIAGLAYNESADRRSWAAMLHFFEEIFE